MVQQTAGDVAARVRSASTRSSSPSGLPSAPRRSFATGPIRPTFLSQSRRLGIGLIEGWRGPVFIALETGPDGTIRRCHATTPPGRTGRLLEHAILGNIVPDFPLINKSFNLSYSGQDG